MHIKIIILPTQCGYLLTYVYIYIYMCVCARVCVCSENIVIMNNRSLLLEASCGMHNQQTDLRKKETNQSYL